MQPKMRRQKTRVQLIQWYRNQRGDRTVAVYNCVIAAFSIVLYNFYVSRPRLRRTVARGGIYPRGDRSADGGGMEGGGVTRTLGRREKKSKLRERWKRLCTEERRRGAGQRRNVSYAYTVPRHTLLRTQKPKGEGEEKGEEKIKALLLRLRMQNLPFASVTPPPLLSPSKD